MSLDFNDIAHEILLNMTLNKIHFKLCYLVDGKLDTILSNQSIPENRSIVDKYGDGYFNVLKTYKKNIGTEYYIDYDNEPYFYSSLAYASIFYKVYDLVLK